MSADLAIVGASVRTLDPLNPTASAVAIRGGSVLAVGSDADVRGHCGPRTEVIDGAGTHLVPGLTDGHLHPVWGTDFAVGADCSFVTTRADLAAALGAERDRVGPAGVVRAWGVDYGLFGAEMDGADLRALAGGPAFAVFFDMHTYLATPEVLERAGLRGGEVFPDGSEVVVRDGRPTGELLEFSTFFQVMDEIAPDAVAQRTRRVAAKLNELNAVGLTGAHVMDGDPSTLALLAELEERDELTMRLDVPLWVKPEHGPEAIEGYLGRVGVGGSLWRGGVAKFFIDGVIDSGTAWLEEPDTRGEGTSPYWPDPDRYRALVHRFATAGFRCTTHAIGDRAVRAALDAYRDAPAPARGMHRIEHFETLGDEALARFVAEGVAASCQPLHMRWRTETGTDEWAARLGPERASRAFRAADMQASGAVLALGSDWPVAPVDPRYGMAWARLRRHPGVPGHVFEPAQRLSAEAALAGYTTGPARIAGDEAVAGRIAPGCRGDLTGFGADPVTTDADDLAKVPVRLTVVAGRVVHRADV